MNIEESLLTVTQYFDVHKVPYVVVGGFAAIVWGRVRTTYDIDIIVDHKKLEIKAFTHFLKSKGLSATEYDINQAFHELSHSSIIVMEKPFYRIDLKGVYSEEDKEAISMAKIIKYKGQSIRFGSPENLIAHKLKYGSDRDLEDAVVVYLAQKSSLNMNYLKLLCERLEVTDKLEKLILENQEE